MATPLNVLLIEDELTSRQMFGLMLQHLGYRVTSAGDAESALETLANASVDIVLSDINLPGLSGLDLLEQVRELGTDCEVVLMTGYASVDSAIHALRVGASDYLVKPFASQALQESLARVRERLVARRQRQVNGEGNKASGKPVGAAAQRASPSAPPRADKAGLFRIGPVVLDLDRHVIEVGQKRVEATPSELEILHCLCLNPDRVVAPSELVQAIRGYTVDPLEASELIRPHISNLRRKLVAASSEADVIATVRAAGYMLKVPPLSR